MRTESTALPALLFLLACAACATPSGAPIAEPPSAPKGPQLLWTLKEPLQAPESAIYDPQSRSIFVSNSSGAPKKKDKNGWITRLDANGHVLKARWVAGLSAPRGMRVHGGMLWVADINEVVGIDLEQARIKTRIPVRGAKALEDIAIGPDGEFYASDMLVNRIFVIKSGKASPFMPVGSDTELEGPRGLLVFNGKLWVAAWGTGLAADLSTRVPGHFYTLDLATRVKVPVIPAPIGNLDGIEMKADGSFLISDWSAGGIHRVRQDGSSLVVLSGFQGPSDIGWIPETGILLVPRTLENQLSAFRLEP